MKQMTIAPAHLTHLIPAALQAAQRSTKTISATVAKLHSQHGKKPRWAYPAKPVETLNPLLLLHPAAARRNAIFSAEYEARTGPEKDVHSLIDVLQLPHLRVAHVLYEQPTEFRNVRDNKLETWLMNVPIVAVPFFQASPLSTLFKAVRTSTVGRGRL